MKIDILIVSATGLTDVQKDEFAQALEADLQDYVDAGVEAGPFGGGPLADSLSDDTLQLLQDAVEDDDLEFTVRT